MSSDGPTRARPKGGRRKKKRENKKNKKIKSANFRLFPLLAIVVSLFARNGMKFTLPFCWGTPLIGPRGDPWRSPVFFFLFFFFWLRYFLVFFFFCLIFLTPYFGFV